MGMLARSAPALNLFAVGFPAALLAGIVLMAMAAPIMGEGIIAAIPLGLEEARRLAAGGSAMSDAPEKDQNTEGPTDKSTRYASEQRVVHPYPDQVSALGVLHSDTRRAPA